MSHRELILPEIRFLEEALRSDYKTVGIRLREGEYQYELSKAIASFQLELYFPDVKDLVKKLYSEEKINDIQLIRKIQTILKKMEKNNVIRILPKAKPWELQRYALSSFKFLDSDKNQISLATDEQIQQTQEKLKLLSQQKMLKTNTSSIFKVRIFTLFLIITFSYAVIIWNLLQPSINPVIFIASLSSATLCSMMLGKVLSRG
ncbi:MAG: hypothetical protein QXY88_01955 [Candidatus Bathyarchaeia archaeon]